MARRKAPWQMQIPPGVPRPWWSYRGAQRNIHRARLAKGNMNPRKRAALRAAIKEE